MRDTGPAVTLAVSYVYNKFPDEIIAVRWSDHLIKTPKPLLTG
jgi:mannose-1-phosphate guanylyltransferase